MKVTSLKKEMLNNGDPFLMHDGKFEDIVIKHAPDYIPEVVEEIKNIKIGVEYDNNVNGASHNKDVVDGIQIKSELTKDFSI